jgi:hypothetical protein
MRSSRGMGAISPSKMPKAKTITRKDNPDKVEMYAEGGKVKPSEKPVKKLPPSGEDMVGTKPLVTDDKGKEYIPEIRRKAKGGKWIQKAIKKPGALRASLGAKKGEPIPAKKLAKAAKAPGKLGQRARFAQVLRGMKK